MAKIPITERQVHRSCDDMLDKGIKPSIRKLKARIGGGTDLLAEYLKSWRSMQPQHTEGQGSSALEIALSSVYDQLVAKALESIAANEVARDHELSEALEAVEKAKQSLQQTKVSISDMAEIELELTSTIDNLSQQLTEKDQQLAINGAQIDNLDRDVKRLQGDKEKLADEISRLRSDCSVSKSALQAKELVLQNEQSLSATLSQALSALKTEYEDAQIKMQDLEKTLVNNVQLFKDNEANSKATVQHLEGQLSQAQRDNALLEQASRHQIEKYALAEQASHRQIEKYTLLEQTSRQQIEKGTLLEKTVQVLKQKLEIQSQTDLLCQTEKLQALHDQIVELTSKLSPEQQ